MNQRLHQFRSACYWLSVVLLSCLPLAMALDFGGVLLWTQWIAAACLVPIALLAWLTTWLDRKCQIRDGWSISLRGQAVFLLLASWATYGYVQTLTLPGWLVGWLSPASKMAYMDWASPLLERPIGWFPISIARADSRHAVCFLAVLALVAWVSAVLFNSRERVGYLMVITAMSGATIGALGIARVMFPGFEMWSFHESSAPFSTFINRNNAALFISVGLAASLGMLCQRCLSHGSFRLGKSAMRWAEVRSTVMDPLVVGALATLAICIVAILVCGSRGALAGMTLGLLVAGGRSIRPNSAFRYLMPGIVVSLVIAICFLPTTWMPQSFLRTVESVGETGAIGGDARLNHWPDGARAAVAHLPAGSGFSSYGYAYLPFQKTSPETWYHHADNLWLELVVEQGIPGIVFAGLLVWCWGASLGRIRHSHDSFDSGLHVMGRYLLASILLSQLFDFGLIIPASAILITLWGVILVVRGQQISPSIVPARLGERATEKAGNGKIRFQSRQPWTPVFSGAGAIMLAACGLPTLQADAASESLAAATKNDWMAIISNQERLRAVSSQAEALAIKCQSPVALGVLSDVQYELARQQEAFSIYSESKESLIRRYRQTSRKNRRWNWRSGELPFNPLAGDDSGATLYQASLQTQWMILEIRPLAAEPRDELGALEFVHQDLDRSQLALDQIRRLFNKNYEVLRRLAVQAGRAEQRQAATQLFYRVIELRPKETMGTLKTASQFPFVKTREILPNNPQVYRLAGRYLTQVHSDDEPLLQFIYDAIRETPQSDIAGEVDAQMVAAELAAKLGSRADSITHLERAIQLDGIHPGVHWKLIQTMMQADRIAEAKQVSRRAIEIFPKDERFKNFLKQHSLSY